MTDEEKRVGDAICAAMLMKGAGKLALARAAIAAMQSWRAVSERPMPKDGQRFLAAIEGVDRAVLTMWNGGEFATIDGNDWRGRNITHWMPLPPPPQEKP